MIHQWKRSLLKGAEGTFERGGKAVLAAEVAEETVRDLHAKIGELAVANDFFFVTKAQALGREVRRGMIERTHPKLSVGAQCRLLSISQSSFYYELMGETAMNLSLILLIDQQFLDTPFYGLRQMAEHRRGKKMAAKDRPGCSS